MTQPDPTIDSEVDKILEKVYGAGLIAGERYTKGKGAGTLTSDTLYSAKTTITNLIAQEANKARVDEIKRVARELAEPKDKETWKDWSWRALYYLENRLKALTADKEQADDQV